MLRTTGIRRTAATAVVAALIAVDHSRSWRSSDETVATVDATGLVTAAGDGTAAVTAGSGAAVGTATVTVAQTIAAVVVEPAGPILTQAGTKGADTIVATASDGGGSPVADASYRWSTDRHSGWVYPPVGTTDALGRMEGTWVAGWPGEGALSVTVENDVSRVTEELATRSTRHVNPPALHAVLWINNWDNPRAGYSIDMTPLTDPAGAFYAAINWDGGYAGLQSARGLLDAGPDAPYNPGTPGCANLAARQHAEGLEVVIGGDTASDPNGSRRFTIPSN
jgi:hypothetical protein